MDSNVILLACLALTSGSFGVSYWLLRRNIQLLGDLQNRENEKNQHQKLVNDHQRLLDKARTDKETYAEDLADAKSKADHHARRIAQLEKDLQAKDSHTKELTERLENKAEFYKTQADVLMVQIKEIDQEKRLLKLAFDQKTAEEKPRLKSEDEQKLKDQIKDTKHRLRTVERERDEIKKTIEEMRAQQLTMNPDEIEMIKKKSRHYYHFYKTLQGQKEMLEERLENWEKGLRILATWILSQQRVTPPKEGIGSLVGTALEIIKQGPLVEDEFSHDFSRPSTPAPQ